MTRSVPTPGRISGVGALVDKLWAVGVADGGNQTMVEVGTGGSVGVKGVGVARRLSMAEQDINDVAIKITSARNDIRCIMS